MVQTEAERTERPVPELGFLDRWLAPLILCGIALVQFVLAHTVDLSPWKGGGFGMFSTVDTPAMRFISASGLDEEGRDIRVDAFELMSESDRLRWQSWPEPGVLERLAERMGGIRYVKTGSLKSRALARFREENPGLDVRFEEPSGGWVRPWRAGDPEEAGMGLRAIRVEGWRIRYDAEGNRMALEALGKPVERGAWP